MIDPPHASPSLSTFHSVISGIMILVLAFSHYSAGLTYHDAVVENGIYEKGISRLPAEMQVERARRMKRALDLSQKHEEIPAKAYEDPWREYKQVNEVLAATQAEADERAILAGKPIFPFNLGREQWHGYNLKDAWWMGGKGNGSPALAAPAPKIAGKK
jgi:Ubiquinol-cytochrome C reductase complex 14kD subunit